MRVIGVFGCPSDRVSGTDRGAAGGEREREESFLLIFF